MFIDFSPVFDFLSVTGLIVFLLFSLLFSLLFFIYGLYFLVSHCLFPYFKKYFLFIKNKFNKSI